MRKIKDMNNTYNISDEYGFWDLSGRNLFFKFPKFSFIEIVNEGNLDTESIFVSDLSINDPLAEALKSQKRKIYIQISDRDIENKLSKIVRILPLCLLNKGRYVDGAVELLDEIIIGVKQNPKAHRELLLKRLKSDRSLSTFSRIRPTETLD